VSSLFDGSVKTSIAERRDPCLIIIWDGSKQSGGEDKRAYCKR
jgi:hypothetical protein